jgi:predicted membrane-bound spermidine synthase
MSNQFHVIPPRWLYFAMFTVSGFSGLIYESIWSHYLKLFLGHAAFAQSLVLVIFMGGMAIGAWLVSRYSSRWKMPLLAYAIVEVVIGLLAMVFHDVFQSIIDVFYFSILPGIGTPTVGSLLKWSAAALLIFPQSVLLGMTFPLMSAGILRRYPSTPGGSLAMLYFTNSIGAAIGVLVSGFWLISEVGLPGTIFTAGLLNIGLAITVWVLIKLDPDPIAPAIPAAESESSEAREVTSLFLVAAFITGAASFIYEIGWIRMLSLVLGSTTHSFELMLSAFITGLAFGGLWIKRRIDNVGDPVRFSGRVQILMGTAALLTLPVYSMSFEWMVGLISALQYTDAGFAVFNLFSHLIALAVMLPATFLAGMTLPLFTFVMMKSGNGEKAIGRVYAANTFGAIVGVVFAINIGLPLLGLKNLIVFGAALDVILGIVLIARSTESRRTLQVVGSSLVGVVAIGIILFGFSLDQRVLISGVYRDGFIRTPDAVEVMYFEDGKTASISLAKFPNGLVAIATNGKPDAAIYMGDENDHSLDEITMVEIGSLPLAYKPDARIIANIGMGSGLTTQTLLASPDIERVDTIEIEPKMAEAAERGFRKRVERTFNDPRSFIQIEDAKTFFSLQNRRYDMILAEPSNPWVSGVASLFSAEFYNTITNYLVEDGLFVQWLQLYEFNDLLVISVLKALSPNFSDYVIYNTGDGDILIIAKKSGTLGDPDFSSVLSGKMAEELSELNVIDADDFLARKLAEKATIETIFDQFQVPANSDYFPILDLRAGKARFRNDKSEIMREWSIAPLPVLELLHDETLRLDNVQLDGSFARVKAIALAEAMYAELMPVESSVQFDIDNEIMDLTARNLSLLRAQCTLGDNEKESLSRWHRAAISILPFLPRERASALAAYMAEPACWAEASTGTHNWLELYQAIAARDVAGMARSATTLLQDDELEADELLQDHRRREYVLTAAMLGLIKTGQSARAHALWTHYGEQHFSDNGPSAYAVLVREVANKDAVGSQQQLGIKSARPE